MAPKLSEDEIDDLLYFARTGEKEEFDTLKVELCKRENVSVTELLIAARDEASGNGVLHMAAANGHHGILSCSGNQIIIRQISNTAQHSSAT
jgi:hypothetical protein